MKSVIPRSKEKVQAIILVLLLGAVGVTGCGAKVSGGNILTHNLSEPLNGATTAKFDINSVVGNLTIDRLTTGEPVLASGTLEYYEKQGPPTRSVSSDGGHTTLAVRGGNISLAACSGENKWQVHLNPNVKSDITAHSDGGNVNIDLAGMAITRLAADTGGGNMDVVLPESAANLGVTARTGGGNVTVEMGNGTTGSNTINAHSGAGNVTVRVPGGIAAKVHATSGLGKVIVDSQFSKVSGDGDTYQSPNYDSAANKVEITVQSGAGNVSVSTK